MSTTPEQEAADLAGLTNHPGFLHLCVKFRKERDALRDAAMDAKTDDDANKLRATWQKLAEFDPASLRANAEQNAKSRAKNGKAT